jgi:hypothetical protein
MRLHWLVSGRTVRNLVLALGFGGIAAASCTFSPGPAGSESTGSSTGTSGSGILGAANSTGSTGTGTSTGTGAGGTTGSSTGTAASNGGTPSPDGSNCGLQQFGLQNVPPDLLIIQDKSGSMANDVNDMRCRGMACVSKWSDVTTAIDMVVSETDTTIRWGLKFFANNNTCGVDAGAIVPIAPMNAMPIANAIAATMPGGSTPTRLAITSGVAYLQSLTDPNPKFILLATDGEPNCIPGNQDQGADDSAGAVMAVQAAAMAGFPVFVVGVGNVAPAIATLNMLADAGGRPQAGATHYYPVMSTMDLVNVLKTIGGMITSCNFSLGKAPPDPSNIGVYANGNTAMKIPHDPTHANGWDYGAGMTSITLYGPACTNVMNMTTKTVETIFGCPGVIIP